MEELWEALTSGCTRNRRKGVQAFLISLPTHTWPARMRVKKDFVQARTGVALPKMKHGPVEPSARNASDSTRTQMQPLAIMGPSAELMPCKRKSTIVAQLLAASMLSRS